MIAKGSHRVNLPMSNLLKGGKPATFWISHIYQLGHCIDCGFCWQFWWKRIAARTKWVASWAEPFFKRRPLTARVTNLVKICTYSALHIFHLLGTEHRLMHIPQHLHTYRVTTAVSHSSVTLYTCQQNCFILNISDMTLPKHQLHYTLTSVTWHYPNTSHTTHFNISDMTLPKHQSHYALNISDITLPKHQSHYILQHPWHHTTWTSVILYTSTSVTSHKPSTSDFTLYKLQNHWHHTNQTSTIWHHTNTSDLIPKSATYIPTLATPSNTNYSIPTPSITL